MTFRINSDPAAGSAHSNLPATARRRARRGAAVPLPGPMVPGAAAVAALPAPPEPVHTPPRSAAPRAEAGESPHTDVKA